MSISKLFLLCVLTFSVASAEAVWKAVDSFEGSSGIFTFHLKDALFTIGNSPSEYATNERLGQVRRSLDGGKTWSTVVELGPKVNLFSAVVTKDNNIFVAGSRGDISKTETFVIASYDKGQTFTEVDSMKCPFHSEMDTIKIGKDSSVIVGGLCDVQLTVRSSRDEGKTWQTLSQFKPRTTGWRISGPTFDTNSKGELFFIDIGSNVYKYTGKNPEWEAVDNSIGAWNQSWPTGIYIDQADTVYVYGSSNFENCKVSNFRGCEFLRTSVDNGKTWKTVLTSDIDTQLAERGYSLSIGSLVRNSEGKLYLSGGANKKESGSNWSFEPAFYTSVDQGRTWQRDLSFNALGMGVRSLDLMGNKVLVTGANEHSWLTAILEN